MIPVKKGNASRSSRGHIGQNLEKFYEFEFSIQIILEFTSDVKFHQTWYIHSSEHKGNPRKKGHTRSN